jgi:hypothetical protein
MGIVLVITTPEPGILEVTRTSCGPKVTLAGKVASTSVELRTFILGDVMYPNPTLPNSTLCVKPILFPEMRIRCKAVAVVGAIELAIGGTLLYAKLLGESEVPIVVVREI